MTNKPYSWHHNSPFLPDQFGLTDWRNSAAGAPGADIEEKLTSKTDDDIEVRPLYLQHPDAPFYSRGTDDWDICQTYRPDRKDHDRINQQILTDLNEGINSIELTLSANTSKVTPPCKDVNDLERLLLNVQPQMIKLSLTPSADNPLYGAMLLAWYHRTDTNNENINAALNTDPIGSQACSGIPATSQLQYAATIANHCAEHFSNVTTFCIDSSIYHNAGGTEAQELAYILATTIDTLRAMSEMDANSAFKQMRFRLALNSDYFLCVAKLRAARELIGQIASQCGASTTNICIDTISGMRSMAALDESVNILRVSTQAAAAMTGGANGYNCAAYDSLTENSTKANRLARNTHHILKEESGLLNVHDPARGSGYIESLTADLCSAAWAVFQQIESAGGMQKALASGLLQQQIKAARDTRSQAIASGEKSIVGVSQSPDLQAEGNSEKTEHYNQYSQSINMPALISQPVQTLIDAIADGKDVTNYQSETNTASTSEPIQPFRDSEAFEKLSARSNSYRRKNNTRPVVSLLTIGEQRDYSARVAFCTSFFATAGIDTEVIDSKEANSKLSQLVVLCSSDNHYIENAKSFCDTLSGNHIWLAGNNPKVTSLLGDSINEAIYLRCNRIDLLDKALTLLGAPAS